VVEARRCGQDAKPDPGRKVPAMPPMEVMPLTEPFIPLEEKGSVAGVAPGYAWGAPLGLRAVGAGPTLSRQRWAVRTLKPEFGYGRY